MLALLNISNIALIDDLQVEFESGLNLLTGETGSGKSIIVDALGLLLGGRTTSDLIKAGQDRGYVEGLFLTGRNQQLDSLLESAGISLDGKDERELVVRRELATSGRHRVFINHQLATGALLRELRPFLVDIHGQGEQQTLFNAETHLELLDTYAKVAVLRRESSERFNQWIKLRREIDELSRDEAERFQLIDSLTFQIGEIEQANLILDEDVQLEEERRRLTNVEKLKLLCTQSLDLLYEDSDSALARLRQVERQIEELAGYDSKFEGYGEGLESARAVLEDLSFALREFADRLDYSPDRLSEIESRLSELTRLKRKYGGSMESVADHLTRSRDRLHQMENSDVRSAELTKEVTRAMEQYLEVARKLHRKRVKAAREFETNVEQDLVEVAMTNARFEVRIAEPTDSDFAESDSLNTFGAKGFDRVEYYFSANVGESVRPLARIASGGEASRLMLVLKVVSGGSEFPRTIVFDEIDTGIGGRVSEAVGAKLKKLAETNQVLCVTHQAQIAQFADVHHVVLKQVIGERTTVSCQKLDRRGRVEEIARMLTGAAITDTARRHAREMLKVGSRL
jgi:DNA repair protein RecN (Recombination protein N)